MTFLRQCVNIKVKSQLIHFMCEQYASQLHLNKLQSTHSRATNYPLLISRCIKEILRLSWTLYQINPAHIDMCILNQQVLKQRIYALINVLNQCACPLIARFVWSTLLYISRLSIALVIHNCHLIRVSVCEEIRT